MTLYLLIRLPAGPLLKGEVRRGKHQNDRGRLGPIDSSCMLPLETLNSPSFLDFDVHRQVAFLLLCPRLPQGAPGCLRMPQVRLPLETLNSTSFLDVDVHRQVAFCDVSLHLFW